MAQNTSVRSNTVSACVTRALSVLAGGSPLLHLCLMLGKTLCAVQGRNGAVSVIALAERGALFDPGPCMYMEKLAGALSPAHTPAARYH